MLGPGATLAELDALAKAIGRELPDSLVELLAWRTGAPPKTKPSPSVLADDYATYDLMAPPEIAELTRKLDRKLAKGGFDNETAISVHAWAKP